MRKLNIKHLVLTGGGPMGLSQYSALTNITKKKIIDKDKIESICATSVGTICGVSYLFKNIDEDKLIKYIIERDWSEDYKLKSDNILGVFWKLGLLDCELVTRNFMEPIFKSEKISCDINLKEFYEYTNVEFKFLTTNVNNNFNRTILSYKNNPDLSLIKAISMSCCVPLLFYPIKVNDNECYLDGGIIENYPLNTFLDDFNGNEDEILGIRNCNKKNIINKKISSSTNLLDFFIIIISSFVKMINHKYDNGKKIKNELIIKNDMGNMTNYNFFIDSVVKSEQREKLLENGISSSEIFINNLISETDK